MSAMIFDLDFLSLTDDGAFLIDSGVNAPHRRFGQCFDRLSK